MSVSLVRIPLSLNSVENNRIEDEWSSSSSTSGAALQYRYPEANECLRLTEEATACFKRVDHEGLIASKKISNWTICSLMSVVGVGILAGLSVRTPAYRHFLIPIVMIGALFCLVISLPQISRARKELNDLQEAENQIYRKAEILMEDIQDKLKEIGTIFPRESFVEGLITENFEINQELKDNLERWIETLRSIHGWENVKSWLSRQPFFQIEKNFFSSDLRRDILILSSSFSEIVPLIEECKADLDTLMSLDVIWPGDSLDQATQDAKAKLCRLIRMIHDQDLVEENC